MPIATLRVGRFGLLMTVFILGAGTLAACGDQLPVAVVDQTLPSVPAGKALQAFDCTASIADGMTCQPAGVGGSGASRAIIDGNNVYIKLASSNAGYDAGTQTFSVDVTVQNLMNEAMGTPDGVTPDPDGIQVFFMNGITANGTGIVTVANGDGTGFFTKADQVFHRYSEILGKDAVSAPKTWRFDMPPTVTSFSFKVLIETDMQYLLVINEVMANPVGAVTTEQPLEWVELYNAGTRPVDLQNLVIADSAASGRRPYHQIASSVVVPSGGYVVLGGSSNTTLNGGAPVDYSYGTALNQLANSLDAVKIARVVGLDTLTLDRTQYSQASISAQEGVSRELKNPALDNSNMDGSNWGNASVTSVYGSGGRGTPKAQNSAYTP